MAVEGHSYKSGHRKFPGNKQAPPNVSSQYQIPVYVKKEVILNTSADARIGGLSPKAVYE